MFAWLKKMFSKKPKEQARPVWVAAPPPKDLGGEVWADAYARIRHPRDPASRTRSGDKLRPSYPPPTPPIARSSEPQPDSVIDLASRRRAEAKPLPRKVVIESTSGGCESTLFTGQFIEPRNRDDGIEIRPYQGPAFVIGGRDSDGDRAPCAYPNSDLSPRESCASSYESSSASDSGSSSSSSDSSSSFSSGD